jgi:hypothetical protein
MPKLSRSRTLLKTLFCGAVLGFSFGSQQAAAQEFCAVTLHVAEPDGGPITSTWIELDDSSGRLVHREMMMGSTLKICDFGFGPHTLKVGTNGCLLVAISNLRMVFGSPLDLHVVLDGCGYREQVRSGCLLYLRVVDDGGKPVSRITFSPRLVTNQLPTTDSYGRYQALFKGFGDLTFKKEGFDPEKVHVECQDSEEIDLEVTMKRAAAPPKQRN